MQNISKSLTKYSEIPDAHNRGQFFRTTWWESTLCKTVAAIGNNIDPLLLNCSAFYVLYSFIHWVLLLGLAKMVTRKIIVYNSFWWADVLPVSKMPCVKMFFELTWILHIMDMLREKFSWILLFYTRPIIFQSKAPVVCSVTTVVSIDFCLNKLTMFSQHMGLKNKRVSEQIHRNWNVDQVSVLITSYIT